MKKRILTEIISAALVVSILSPAAVIAHEDHKTTIDFKDIDTVFWGRDTINWGLDNHIVSGYPDMTFKPNGKITEAEFLTMALKYFPQTGAESFLKASNGEHWATPYYQYASSNGLPVTNHKDTAIRRGGAAHLVAILMGQHVSEAGAIDYLMSNNLAKGRGEAGFAPNENLTRTEAVQFLKNIAHYQGGTGVDGTVIVEGLKPVPGEYFTLPDGTRVKIAGGAPKGEITSGGGKGNVDEWNNFVSKLIESLDNSQKKNISEGEKIYSEMFKGDYKAADKLGEHAYAAIVKTTVNGSKARVYIPQGLGDEYKVNVIYADINDSTIQAITGNPEYIDVDLKDRDFVLKVSIKDMNGNGVIVAGYDSLAEVITLGGNTVDKNVSK